MNYKAFTGSFKKQVYALSYEKQLAFALAICKRLYFDYQNFYNQQNCGNPELLMDAIKLCEQANKAFPPTKEIESLLSKVEAITPDTEDYGEESCSYAVNACVAVLYTLQFLLTKDPSAIFFVGIALYDTIDLRIQEGQDLSAAQLYEHPLLQETKQYLLEQTIS